MRYTLPLLVLVSCIASSSHALSIQGAGVLADGLALSVFGLSRNVSAGSAEAPREALPSQITPAALVVQDLSLAGGSSGASSPPDFFAVTPVDSLALAGSAETTRGALPSQIPPAALVVQDLGLAGGSSGDTSRLRLLDSAVSTVPEPSSRLLLGAGLVGLVVMARKSKQAPHPRPL